jgi:CheY-like chemotaxis protein
LLRADRQESLGQLASGVAHDLNNMLLPILMAAELLEEQVPSAEQELLRVIRGNAERGSKLLKQLLKFGRGSESDRSPLRLAAAVDEILPILNSTFPKSVRIKRDIRALDTRVVADSTQLQQVLMNLCVNARDAMPHGGELTIFVSLAQLSSADCAAHPGAEPGRYAVLSVKDEGVGMTEAELGRIFEPFYSTKPPNQGTGLGLSSVLGIVKAHRGFVEVASTPGVGSEFRALIPEYVAEDAPLSAADGPRTPRRISDRTVLLVDDEPSILQGLRACATHQGYRVVTARDGQSALTLLTEDHGEIGVVVTDLAMPKMSGLGLIRELRARGKAVEVVVMLGGAPDHAELRALGVRHVLHKPFGLPQLIGALEAAFADG